jgi:predicted amidohydrolase
MAAVALIQMDLAGGYDGNLAKAGHLVAEAARQGADLALLPELTAWPWCLAQERRESLLLAEPEGGPTLRHFRELARMHELNLAFPLYEEDGGVRYNTTWLVSRAGAVLGRYRKNHIPYQPPRVV